MKTIYLVYQIEGEYDSYQETVLKAFLTKAKATNYRAECTAKTDEKNAAAAACEEDIREWRRHNPLPDGPVWPVNDAWRAWNQTHFAARRALNPDNLYKSDKHYEVREVDLDDDEE